MTNLDRLIADLCPDGAKYYSLGEISEIRSGWGFPNVEQGKVDGDYPFFKVSDMNLIENSLRMTVANNYIDEDVSKKLGCRPAPEGATIFPKIGAAIATNKKRILTQASCYDNNVVGVIPNESVHPYYLYYHFQSIDLTMFCDYSGALPSIRKSTLENYRLPLPPLVVQREIVRILDNFTELTAELTAKLTAELTARKKQYEYYRNALLTFGNDVPMVPLGEIATDMYRGAGIKREEVTEDGTPCVRYGEIYTTYGIWFDTCVSHTQSGTKTFEHGDILFAITGENVEEIAKSCAYMGHEKCYAGGDTVVMKHKQNPKYIAYALSTADAQAQKSRGKVKSKVVHSSVPALKAITIPLPSLEEQARIVAILDKFDALTTDITNGLPAEVEARRKQYEYYRDKLLTFKEVGA